MALNRPTRKQAVLLTALCLTGLILLVAGSVRWDLNAAWLSQRLNLALRDDLGYTVRKVERASFSALPIPNILVTGLEVERAGDAGERLSVPLAKARLNLASWLMGAPRITTLSLIDPAIHVPDKSPAFTGESLATAVYSVFKDARTGALRSLRIQKGRLLIGQNEVLSQLHVLAIDMATSDFQLTIHGTHSGMPFAASAEFGHNGTAPLRPLRWTITSDLGDVRFSGVLLGPKTFDSEGYLFVRIASAERWKAALGHAPPLIHISGGMRIAGDARLIGSVVQMRQALIERDEQSLSGAVEFSLSLDKPQLTATLDTARLDVSTSPIHGALSSLARNNGWSSEPYDLNWLETGRIDLRLSARQLLMQGLTIEQAALALNIGHGRAEIALNDGRLGGGTAKARLLAIQQNQALDLRLTGVFERLDIAQLSRGFLSDRIKGLAQGAVYLEAKGRSEQDMASSLEGRVQITLRDGEFSGVDLDGIAAPDQARRTSGRTRIQNLTQQWSIEGGVATLTNGILQTPTQRIPLSGTLSIRDRTSDLTAILRGSDGNANDVRMEGPWSQTRIRPAILQRGGRS